MRARLQQRAEPAESRFTCSLSFLITAAFGTLVFLGTPSTLSAQQTATARSIPPEVLRQYSGVYQWGDDRFLYLQFRPTLARAAMCWTVICSKGFSSIRFTSASPKALRVCTTRRSFFFCEIAAFLDTVRSFVPLRFLLFDFVLTLSGFALILRFMTDERKSGLALILGTAGFLLVMVFHPRGGGIPAPDQLESMLARNVAVHSLALARLRV